MKVCKIFDWCYGHHLNLSYPSHCAVQHGHNAIIHIEVEGPLNKDGMIVDFNVIKKMVEEVSFDHKNLNDLPYFKDKNPTAENMVNYLYDSIDRKWLPKNVKICRIRVYETQTSWAEENY